MDIIPGYWDPKNLCFIEDKLELNQLELCTVGASAGDSDQICNASIASNPETGDASCKTRKC